MFMVIFLVAVIFFPNNIFAVKKNNVSVCKITKNVRDSEKIKKMIKKKHVDHLNTWFAQKNNKPQSANNLGNLLHYSIKNGSFKTSCSLVCAGANPLFRIKGKTAYQYAEHLHEKIGNRKKLSRFLCTTIKKNVHKTEFDLLTHEPFKQDAWENIHLTPCCNTPFSRKSIDELEKRNMLCPNCRADIFEKQEETQLDAEDILLIQLQYETNSDSSNSDSEGTQDYPSTPEQNENEEDFDF